jgi:hypothetical protein
MVRTSSGAPKDFEARVHTAITFLQQIRDDEYAVSSYNAESSRYIVSKQEFCAAFNRHGFPSIYRKAACAYRTRLEELRKEKRQIYLSLRERWDDLEKHPILSIDEHAADTPLRASDKKMHHGTSNAR